MADDKATDEQVFESIVRQWEGGEHANAGKRASLFMQAKPKGKREELETEFKDRAPGIGDYFVDPGAEPRTDATEDPDKIIKRDDPLGTGPANVSSQEGKAEIRRVDKALAPGRKVDEKAKRGK